VLRSRPSRGDATRIAWAAFPSGNPHLPLADELGALFKAPATDMQQVAGPSPGLLHGAGAPAARP
jgi:hypothetical protein